MGENPSLYQTKLLKLPPQTPTPFIFAKLKSLWVYDLFLSVIITAGLFPVSSFLTIIFNERSGSHIVGPGLVNHFPMAHPAGREPQQEAQRLLFALKMGAWNSIGTHLLTKGLRDSPRCKREASLSGMSSLCRGRRGWWKIPDAGAPR